MNKIKLERDISKYGVEFWTLIGYLVGGNYLQITMYTYVLEAFEGHRISMKEASELCMLISQFYTNEEEMTKREAEL